MIIILISLTLFLLSIYSHIPESLAVISNSLHLCCLRTLPDGLQNRQSLEALVCGKNLENLELKHLLIQTSLIHIFIVSGSHFLFLHKILAWLLRSRWWPFLPLAVYALMTLCQPPGVRSLCFLFLAELSQRYKATCSPVVLIFASALLSLAVFPHWIESRSLLMSLMAALVICFMSELWGEERKTLPGLFATQSTIYFFMAFCLWGFSNLHPLGILLNLLLGPLIGVVIFPLALLVVIFPFLGFLFDASMNGLLLILQQTNEVLAWHSESSPLAVIWQWGLFLVLLVSSYVFLVNQKRKKIYEF